MLIRLGVGYTKCSLGLGWDKKMLIRLGVG